MGGSTWDDDHYTAVTAAKTLKHGTSFTYDRDVTRGTVTAAVHPDLDPRKLKNGIRESRDSAAHPNSNAIIIGLDVTGSMGHISREVHSKLKLLMGILLRRGEVQDPQILFAAIGDAYTDKAPLQVGQFESGVEMEDALSKFYLEGLGGGQTQESYELFAHFAANHTSIDCFEKRGQRGYCFIIGDEQPYPTLNSIQVWEWLGTKIEGRTTEKVFEALKEKYNTFCVRPRGAGHSNDTRILDRWKELLGNEFVIDLEDTNAVAEVIATQIGLCEGATVKDLLSDLGAHGASNALVKVVERAVKTTHRGGAVSTTTAFPSSNDSIERI